MPNWYSTAMVVADSKVDPDCKFRFSVDECKKIISMVADKMTPLQVNTSGGAVQNDFIRKTEGCKLEMNDDTMWVYDKLMNSCEAMKEGRWPLTIDGFQPIQILKYEVGGKYDMHIDLGPGFASHRKISCTVQLSDESEYEGGELSFVANAKWNHASKEIGSMTIFPSYILHKIEPVKSGTRYAMVVWFVGDEPMK